MWVLSLSPDDLTSLSTFRQDNWVPNLDEMQKVMEATLAARKLADSLSRENLERRMAQHNYTWDDLTCRTNSLGTSRGNLTNFEKVCKIYGRRRCFFKQIRSTRCALACPKSISLQAWTAKIKLCLFVYRRDYEWLSGQTISCSRNMFCFRR